MIEILPKMDILPQKCRDPCSVFTTVCCRGHRRRRNEVSLRNFKMEMRRKKAPRARCCFHSLLVIYVIFSTTLAFLYISNNVLIPRGLYFTVSFFIMLTCPCNVDLCTPHFYIVKSGSTEVYIVFLFLL